MRKMIIFLAGVYLLISSLVFVPLYNWQYAQTHGFVKWLVFGEVVATLKAFVWPYWIINNQSDNRGASQMINSRIQILNPTERELLVDRPGDEYAKFEIDQKRKLEIEQKLDKLAILTNTPKESVYQQYYEGVEHITGLNLDKLQVAIWKLLEKAGAPQKDIVKLSKLDCLIYITSQKIADNEQTPLTYDMLRAMVDGQIEKFSKT